MSDIEIALSNIPDFDVMLGDKVLRSGESSTLWGDIGGNIANQSDLANALANKASSSDLTAHTLNDDIHVTVEDKALWDAKQGAIADLSTIRSNATLGATVSHPNIFDNPFFTVNQRGQSSYTASGSTYINSVDRCRFCSGTVSVLTKGINFTSAGSANYKRCQFCVGSIKAGTYTFSVHCKVNSITGDSQFHVFQNRSAGISIGNIPITETGEKWWQFTFTLSEDVNLAGVEVLTGQQKDIDIDIYSIKLEHGNVSTLANDNEPDYGEALRRCRRYYANVINPTGSLTLPSTVQLMSSANRQIRFTIPMEQMAADPTASFSGTITLYGFGGDTTTLSSIDSASNTTIGVEITAKTAGTPSSGFLVFNSGTYIELSADF